MNTFSEQASSARNIQNPSKFLPRSAHFTPNPTNTAYSLDSSIQTYAKASANASAPDNVLLILKDKDIKNLSTQLNDRSEGFSLPISSEVSNTTLLNSSTWSNIKGNAKDFPKSVPTKTLHITYNPNLIDRGDLYLRLRQMDGFDLMAFYDKYCFARFLDGEQAAQALQSPKIPRVALLSFDAAKHKYLVPYPQPDDGNVPSIALHITHLPSHYTKDEMGKIFSILQGFSEAHFYGKYGYVYFTSSHGAMRARHILRQETNLVVSYAKNPPKTNCQEEVQMPMNLQTSHSLNPQTSLGNPQAYRPFAERQPMNAPNSNSAKISLNPLPAAGISRRRQSVTKLMIDSPLISYAMESSSTATLQNRYYDSAVLSGASLSPFPMSSSYSNQAYSHFPTNSNYSSSMIPRDSNYSNSMIHRDSNYSNSLIQRDSNYSNSLIHRDSNYPSSPNLPTSPTLPFPLDDESLGSQSAKYKAFSPLSQKQFEKDIFSTDPFNSHTHKSMKPALKSPSCLSPSIIQRPSTKSSHGGLVTAQDAFLQGQTGSLAVQTQGNHVIHGPATTNLLAFEKSETQETLHYQIPLFGHSSQIRHEQAHSMENIAVMTSKMAVSESLIKANGINESRIKTNAINESSSKTLAINESHLFGAAGQMESSMKRNWNPMFYGGNLNFGLWSNETPSSI